MSTIKDNEAIYDAEIAPALLAIGQRCEEIGMPLLALAEWKAGEVGRTETIPPGGACLPFTMVWMLARSAPNVDGFLINLMRYCEKTGIDTGASMFLTRFEKATP